MWRAVAAKESSRAQNNMMEAQSGATHLINVFSAKCENNDLSCTTFSAPILRFLLAHTKKIKISHLSDVKMSLIS